MATALTASGIQFPDDTVTSTNLLPSGTRLLFHNSSAPTGWTKDTSINDSALRVVSGTPGSGGSAGFTSAFGSPSVSGSVSLSGDPGTGNLSTSVSGNVSIGSTTLSTNQMPSHSHNIITGNSFNGNQPRPLDDIGGFGRTPTETTGGSGSHNHNASVSVSGNISGAPSRGTLAGAL